MRYLGRRLTFEQGILVFDGIQIFDVVSSQRDGNGTLKMDAA